jgi:LuxR family maltose regulon positive regulatory protein
MNPQSPLLTTKLFVPQLRAARVARPRLLARLDRGLAGKLTLVSAPAGFGKTTLISEWLEQGQRPFTWLSLDEEDDEPTRFLTYVGAALARLDEGWGQIIEIALRTPQLPPAQSIAAMLVNEISASRLEFVFVLDDYHVISDTAIHELLTFLVDHLPRGMHLVLITRADPPLPLARLRASDQLTEIRADSLRFSSEETASFLTRVMGLGLTPEQIAVLESRTEGWIAGLQLAALSLQGLGHEGDLAGFIAAFAGSHRYVMDYLMEEVFRRQPHPIQEFLLQTSILDRLSAPLCDAVLGDREASLQQGIAPVLSPSSTSPALLAYLEDHNLFTVPLDHERSWYRYHHLFADLLRDRLRQVQPERVPDLHRRAAAWFERNGLMEEAVYHALQAQDYELAVRLIRQVAFFLWRLGKIYTLLSWMRAMPEALIRSDINLSGDYAAALTISGQLDAVEPWLRTAENQLKRQPASPSAPFCLAHVFNLRAHLARFAGTPAEALAFSQRAMEHTPTDRPDIRGVTLLHKGHAHLMDGDAAAAEESLSEACDICQAIRHPAAYLSAAHYLAQLRICQGRLREAWALYRAAGESASRQEEVVYAGIEQIGLGDLLREWNDLDTAGMHIREGLRLAEMGGDFVFLREGYLASARLEQALGNLDRALSYVDKAERVVQPQRSPWETSLIELWRARLYLAAGDQDGAMAWARSCGLSPDDELRFVDELGHLTLAQVLITENRLDQAGHLLERLLQAAESAGRWGRLIHILIAQALARQTSGDISGALKALERALILAEPEGYVRTFLDAGPAMMILLRKAASQGSAISYARRLLAASSRPYEHADAPQLRGAAPGLVEPLTARELEVLSLVSAGLRNQEIADQLVISLATVKRHLSNIYGKLGVSHRTEAVAHAQGLGLLMGHS